MLNEKFFRALFFVVIVSAGVYYFYPTELNEAQRLAYLKSYGVTLGLTIGGTAIGVTLGFIFGVFKIFKYQNFKLSHRRVRRYPARNADYFAAAYIFGRDFCDLER